MAFILSKIYSMVFMPFPFFLLSCIVISFFISHKKIKRVYQLILFVVTILSTPICSNFLIRVIELDKQSDISFEKDVKRVGVVLGGYASSSTIGINFGDPVDRLIYGLELLAQGKFERLVITGGVAVISAKEGVESKNGVISETRMVSDWLLHSSFWGSQIKTWLKSKKLLLETKARNTKENAKYTQILLAENKLEDKKIIVITSAFHMRRALACFKKVFQTIGYYSIDVEQSALHFERFESYWPNISSLARSQLVVKELIGIIAYFFLGYL